MPDLESSRPAPNSGNSPGPHHGYDPNQPRVPSGHSDGGQWTKTGRRHSRHRAPRGGRRPQQAGKLGLLRRRLPRRRLARGAARVQSRPQPHRLRIQARPAAPGTGMSATPSFSRKAKSSHSRTAAMCSGSSTAKAIWSAPLNGPRTVFGRCRSDSWHSSRLRSAVALLGEAAGLALNAAALSFFTWLSSRKDPAKPRSSLSTLKNMKGLKHREMKSDKLFSWDSLTRDEVGSLCAKLKDIQGFTDAAS